MSVAVSVGEFIVIARRAAAHGSRTAIHHLGGHAHGAGETHRAHWRHAIWIDLAGDVFFSDNHFLVASPQEEQQQNDEERQQAKDHQAQ